MAGEMSKKDWNLRYAPHLGYRSPEAPLFKESVGTLDPVAHVRFAAELGFAGVLDPLTLMRAPDEQTRIGEALVRHDQESGCVLYAPPQMAVAPLWGKTDATSRAVLERQLSAAFEAARRVSSRKIAVVSGSDPALPRPIQYAAAIQNLSWAAEFATRADMILCVEAISPKAIPGMLFDRLLDSYMIVKAVDCPAVRLIFDTAHVQSADGDLIANLELTWDAIEIVQICDSPGRVEPGAGELNMGNVLRILRSKQYRGLVELEHEWAHPGIDSERKGLHTLRQLDLQA